MADALRLVRTCDACPTQYDLFFPDGRYGYFRYRHSRYRLELYRTPDAFWGGEPITEVGDQLAPIEHDDGFLSHSEVMGLLEVALPKLLQQAGDVEPAPARVTYERRQGPLLTVTFEDRSGL